MNPSMPRNISFTINTMYAGRGRVGVIRPDANGVYCGLPMMTLGETTQQNTYYDPQSMVAQITGDTRFGKIFRSQKLFGEYGHPSFLGMNDSDKMNRLVTVEEKSTSHLFTKIYTDTPTADGNVVVRADVKPAGPFAVVMRDSLDDPLINTAFSLRAYVDTSIRPNGLKYRTVRSLITWDCVGASGYAGTDKAHAIGLESFASDNHLDYEIQILKDGNLMIDQIALETYSNTDLNEIFGVSNVQKIIQSRTFVETDKALIERFPNLYSRSLFHDYFKDK